MSMEENTLLIERAAEMIDYFVDKQPAHIIELDIEKNDLQALKWHVEQAEAVAAQQEHEQYDTY